MRYRNNHGWENSMGDFLNGRVGVNQLTPKSPLLNDIGMWHLLNDNKQYHLVLTQAEASEIIDQLTLKVPEPGKNKGIVLPEDFARSIGEQVTAITTGEAFSRRLNSEVNLTPVFKLTGAIAEALNTYSGNLYDTRGLYQKIMEFKSLGINAKTFFGANGVTYIHISGYPGIRKILTGTRYLQNNARVLEMGIGKLGVVSNIKDAARFCIIFSGAYRVLEIILRSDYTLANFIGNIAMDMAKIAVGAAVSMTIGALFTSTAIVGGSVILVAVGLFFVGFVVTEFLNHFDKKYGISEKIIAELKRAMKRKVRLTEANIHDAFNNSMYP